MNMLDTALKAKKAKRKPQEVAIFKEDRRGHVFMTRQMISPAKVGMIEQKLKTSVVHQSLLLDTTTTNYPYTVDHARIRFTEMGWISSDELEEALKAIGSDPAVFTALMAEFQKTYDARVAKIIKEDRERIEGKTT
jgi:hypothetical protein